MNKDKWKMSCLEISLEDPDDCMPEHFAYCYSWEDVERELKYLKERYTFNDM